MKKSGIYAMLWVSVLTVMLSLPVSASPQARPALAQQFVMPLAPSCDVFDKICADLIKMFMKDVVVLTKACLNVEALRFSCHTYFVEIDRQLSSQVSEESSLDPLKNGKVLQTIRFIKQQIDKVLYSDEPPKQ